MGRRYTVGFENVAVSAAQDFFEVTAPSTNPVLIHGWTLSNVGGTADAGDAQEEMLRLTTNRGVGATSGSGGSAATPAKLDSGDAAAAATVEVNNTTIMSGGTITELERYGWNVRVPMMKIYTPEFRPRVAPGDRWTLELPAAPADAINISGTLDFEEI